MKWKTIEADGCTWEVRSVVNSPDPSSVSDEDLLEFRTANVNMPPRRIVVSAGALEGMSDEDLRAAYMRARPIGGDHYGRPGKRMTDVG
ncbi:MAG TPA: hypothetical protein VHG09_07060 [Longimicrobiales bacterium]|nr:hypothetical protein [Longimicrobiales bacterium]